MRILVCGGAGFIGSTFVRRRLASSGDEIVVLDKLTYAGNRANLADVARAHEPSGRYRFVQGDIADGPLVRQLVREGDVDAVVNFAAESHVDRSILDAEDFLRTGVVGVHRLLEATRTHRDDRVAAGRPGPRLLQVSTDEVYGSISAGYASESHPLEPRSPYSAAKAAGDLLALAYSGTYGLDVVVTRGANTYGPYQHPEKVIPLFITNALQHLPLPLYGDGQQKRHWLHVSDHADAIGVVLDSGAAGSIYNVPGAVELTNLELGQAILGHLDRPTDLMKHVPDRPGHDRRYAIDGTSLAALGWAPAIEFASGLESTVDWYRKNEAWWRALQDDRWSDYYERQYGSRLSAASEG